MKPNASNRVSASFLFVFIAALVIFPLAPWEPNAPSHAAMLKVSSEKPPQYVPGQLLVKFKGTPKTELLHQYHLQLQERLDNPVSKGNQLQSLGADHQTYLVKFDESKSPEEMAAEISMREGVEYAEPNYRYYFKPSPTTNSTPLRPIAFLSTASGHSRG